MKFQLHTNFHCLGCKFLVKLKKKIKNIILLTKKIKVIMRECLTPKRTYNIFRVKLHFVNISQIFLSFQWFLGYFGFFFFLFQRFWGYFGGPMKFWSIWTFQGVFQLRRLVILKILRLFWELQGYLISLNILGIP